jgi:hypothetical protein
MARITINYIPYNTDVGFLRIKQQYISVDVWRIAFFIHVYASLWVLFAGFTQFSKRLLKNSPRVHRVMGYIYVCNVLLITGPAGFIMGFYANGGLLSRVAFVLLAALWMSFTAIAFMKAKQRKFVEHRQFMIRSYALTLSALTLRAWKFAITNTTDAIHPMDVYRIVAWLGWGLNLIIAEWLIRTESRRKDKKVLYPNGRKALLVEHEGHD